ncbi:hypothetical protein V2O64_10530 [Verrucomicrobiaceae bacterium 227]
MKTTLLLPLLVGPALAGSPDFTQDLDDGASLSTWNPLAIFSGLQRLDLGHDLLHSADIDVQRSTILYQQDHTSWTLEANLAFTDIGVDYRDPVGATSSSFIREESWSGGLTLGKNFSDTLSATLGFSTYEGFTDFQSAWISEYYDQFVGIPFARTYDSASPQGAALSTGLVWDYLPGTARLTAKLSFSRDDIVPAWSAVPNPDNFFIPEAQATPDVLDTYQASVTWEAALNPRLKSQVTFRYSDITARSPRYQLRNQWAWAITSQLTARAHIGGAIERPDFEALYGGLALDYQLNSHWSISAAARFYRDTGEVVSAGFNTAAPSLDSYELSASVAWSNGPTTLRLGAGIYDTDYDEPDEDNQFFANLYQDRDYFLGRFALSHSF